jgi:hypothetical protein
MIKHIVMFRIKGVGETKIKNINTFKDRLDELKNKISVVRCLETGINTSTSKSAFDLVLITQFDSEHDLDVYRNHSDHQKIVDLIKDIVSEVAVVDYSI